MANENVSVTISRSTLASVGQLFIILGILVSIILSPNYSHNKYTVDFGEVLNVRSVIIDLSYLGNIAAILLLWIGTSLVEKHLKFNQVASKLKMRVLVPVISSLLILYTVIASRQAVGEVAYIFWYPGPIRVYLMIRDSNLGLLIVLGSILLVILSFILAKGQKE